MTKDVREKGRARRRSGPFTWRRRRQQREDECLLRLQACKAVSIQRAVEFIGALQILPECSYASNGEAGMGWDGSQIVC